MTFIPFPHQIVAQNIMKNMEDNGNGGFLADAMGLGKTATMCMFLKANKFQDVPDLIVCPVSVLQSWIREIKTVKDYPIESSDPSILLYHGPNRVAELKKGGWDYVITTYNIIRTGELKMKRWGRVVLDESHTIKNGLRKGVNKPKCAVAAFDIGKRSRKNWCISGTPFNNRIADIGAQCCFIGTAPYDDPNWWDSPSDEDLQHWRETFVLQRTKDKLLQPPEYHDILVSPFKDETNIVNIIRSKAAKNFKRWKGAHGYHKVQLQAKVLALITKLRVISNSYYCGETLDNPMEVMQYSAKVARMVGDFKEQLHEDPKKGLVVFSQFTSFLDILEKVIEVDMPSVEVLKFNGSLNGKKRDMVVSRFNESRNPRILLISMGAGGVGLSLHHGSSTVFISEPNFNPFLEQQSEERVHRLGQDRRVRIFRYVMENSVETWINGLKMSKMAQANNMGLVKTDEPIKSYSMNDLSDLFSNFVSFTTTKDKPVKKTKADKDQSDREDKRKKMKQRKALKK